MKLFTAVYDDATLLPHFLSHYAAAGVDEFFIAIAPEFSETVGGLASAYSIRSFEGLDLTDSLLAGTAAVTSMRKLHQKLDEWVLIVDLDEFVEFDDPVSKITSQANDEGANVVRGILFDRFGLEGMPAKVTFDTDLAQRFPIKSRFTRHVRRGFDHKGVLVKGRLASAAEEGHHRYEGEFLYSRVLEISHYKWIAGSIERLRRSYEKVRASGMSWAIEYERVLNHYDTHGRFAWETFGGERFDRYIPQREDVCGNCGAPITAREYEYSIALFAAPRCRTHQRQADHAQPVPGVHEASDQRSAAGRLRR